MKFSSTAFLAFSLLTSWKSTSVSAIEHEEKASGLRGGSHIDRKEATPVNDNSKIRLLTKDTKPNAAKVHLDSHIQSENHVSPQEKADRHHKVDRHLANDEKVNDVTGFIQDDTKPLNDVDHYLNPHEMQDPNNDADQYVTPSETQAPVNDVDPFPTPKQQPATERFIVTYKDGCKSGTMDVMKIASAHRAADEPEVEVDFDFDDLNTLVVTGTEKEIEEIENDPNVLSVEKDVPRYPMSIRDSNADISHLFDERNLMETRPYGVDLVEAPALWAQGATGQGVKVCVIDSGIDADHPDFVNSNLSGAGSWFQDGCGHGTHVSGTISGKDNNLGVIGVAPDAEIFTVRVFGNDCGFSSSTGVYNAARICRANGADIISMSLGGPRRTNFEDNVFKALADDGILLVAAAGNGGDSSFSFPASYPSVMSVGAVNRSKRLASFSQTNSQVDIVAPGVGVLSTFPVGRCTICRGNTQGFGAIDGTSMATPHVSGVAALLKSAVPSATGAELRRALEQSAQDLGEIGKDIRYGNGLVQADAALTILNGGSGGGGGGTCTDFPGWHDAEGATFDCAWYAQKSNCAVYGSGFANASGQTADDACCACGGGTITSAATSCKDVPKWHDSEGTDFNCEWYAQEGRCEKFGDGFANLGKTANEACCACQNAIN